MTNTTEVLVLRQGATGYLLRKKMKYQKLHIKKGRVLNTLTSRELAFVKANIPSHLLNFKNAN